MRELISFTMKPIPDLIALHDRTPGVRTLLEVEVREASPSPLAVEAPSAQRLDDSQPSTLNSQPSLDFIASTATLDRYHEVIEPAGWRLESYRRNPVFQNAHNYGDILFTLGKALSTEVRTIGNRAALCQRIQFAVEVNPVARIAYGLYKGGFLNAVSVGFIPLRWEDGESGSAGGASGPAARRRYLEQELLEVSAVAIPANPDALALGLKSGAVSKADLKETLELLRGLMGAVPESEGTPPHPPSSDYGAAGVGAYKNHWLEVARELRQVMRKV